jgi:hypothetical protein
MALTYILVEDATTGGQIASFNTTTGQVAFVPDPNFNGSAGYFTYKVNNGYFDSDLATVNINVTSVNDAPNITTTPPSQTYNVGDAYSYSPILATDPDHTQDELVWSLIGAPSWIELTTTGAGFTGTASLADDGSGVREGNFTFTIRVTDGGDPLLYDEQQITIGGLVPTIDTYFKIIFDSSGSMSSTEPKLERDLRGDGVTDAYNDCTCLKSYLQDFYASGGTQGQGNNDSSTNGSDEFDSKVSIISNGAERPFYWLNNLNNGFGATQFPNADTVNMLVFTDENSAAGVPYNSYTPSNSVPNAASMTYLTNLKNNIDSFSGNYRGILFAVNPGSIDGRGVMQTMYDALNESTGSSFDLQNNSLINYTSQVSIGNPVDLNQMFGHILIDDGNTNLGYYTEIVVNALRDAGYSIAPYCGGSEIP